VSTTHAEWPPLDGTTYSAGDITCGFFFAFWSTILVKLDERIGRVISESGLARPEHRDRIRQQREQPVGIGGLID
jgi:hypothetical protein